MLQIQPKLCKKVLNFGVILKGFPNLDWFLLESESNIVLLDVLVVYSLNLLVIPLYHFFNNLSDFLCFCAWVEVNDAFSCRIHHKFCKIPRHLPRQPVVCVKKTGVFSQIGKSRGCIIPVYLWLGKHGEICSVAFARKFFNFLVRSGLLAPKLVAGEGQNLETRVPVQIVEIGQLTIVIFG